ncbi:MAG TPA: hypothetical protein VFZ22_21930 [Pyrinomonadaceae bacterium]|nr:hypothetical protein [Pyrinomonadaceae bacterium]
MKQPRDVVEAYRVCAEFQRVFADDLDFDRAFEATFTKDPKRRREIAIAESELGDVDLTQVDDATLLSVYKDQNQLFFLMLPLIDAKDELDRAILFPTQIEAIFERLKSKDNKNLSAYAEQLHRDVTDFRAHLNDLAAKYPRVAEGIHKYKQSLSGKLEPPTSYVVKPLTAYSKGRVLALNEKYYQIESYAVIREGAEMRIIGIRFFSRLF